jgi:GTP-binding protein Era
MGFKSGFVTLIGRPNVGKSTLLNKMTGEKIAITSEKPQTTRNVIRTIITDDKSQMIFIDTPGIHKPKNKLGEYMVSVAEGTLNEVDVVLFLVEATNKEPGPGDLFIIEQLKNLRTPVFLIINKIDTVNKEQLLPIIKTYSQTMDYESVIPVSAINNEGMDIIFKEIRKVLPEGPKYYPDDQLTDQPEKFIVAELIREKVLRFLSEEVPHGVGIEIISFKEKPEQDMVSIQANIYCEKDSHKGIIIGRNGKMLKKIGTLAREETEKMLGAKVFLELWVKVKPDWRNNNNVLRTLGYTE